MNRNPVCWFEIHAEDLARARKFYETVFAIRLERLNAPGVEMLGFPMQKDGAGAPGALVRDETAAGGSGTLVYFGCADCAVEESRVEAAGGRVRSGKEAIGEYGFVSLVIDSEGNLIGLHSLK